MLGKSYINPSLDIVDSDKPLAFFKFMIAFAAVFFIALIAEYLGPDLTFFLLNLSLSLYLVSSFQGKLKYFFLIQPIFVYLSSFGFEVPWREIGVGYAYTHMYELFTNQSGIDLAAINERLEMVESNSILGLGVVYVGTIPQLLLTDLLFDYPSERAYYFSQSTVGLFYAAIAAFYGIITNNIKREVLLIPLLIFIVSPTFLELNSNLHRYSLLVFGLLLFIISYFGVLSGKGIFHRLIAVLILLLSLAIILVSKQAIILCLVLFVLLERFSAGKLPIFSNIFLQISENLQIFIVILAIAFVQYFITSISDFYATIAFTGAGAESGGGIKTLLSVPILGLSIRLLYAVLSPFPFMGFSQWALYGENEVFLFIHIFSSVFCAWVIASFFLNLKRIINASHDIRIFGLFGVSILCSLAMSSVGFHAYLAPAMPFLSVILLQRDLRIMILYPIWFIVLLEMLAHVGRLA
ncbi:hypothetical protein N9E88_03895 [Gammaproteobacteria bacterium]|nr:hypothetical protein [Gammaproteobacteria bacterium]MDA9175262.1 hypothetical protein [Gammaproteobacteria bacterium]MDA9834610.1 hypothetical protein [Gammaproteobacteria bacterium]MDA9979387.1 hypothetical protein [Gammaproteobacteria bacterium]MDC3371974.1 hypothetical protein [Gammaproteobacteria bacterium]